MKKIPIGVTLNNLLNMKYSDADKWQGLNDPPKSGVYFWFSTPAYGIRAAARQLITYQDKHHRHTIKEIISAWAPTSENPTRAYIDDVCDWTGFTEEQELDLHSYADLRPLVEAMIHQEQGYVPCSGAVIDKGLQLAGVEPAREPSMFKAAVKDPKTIIATVAATATGVQAAVAPVAQVWDTINSMGIDPRYLIWGVCAAVAAAALYLVADWVKARQEHRA